MSTGALISVVLVVAIVFTLIGVCIGIGSAYMKKKWKTMFTVTDVKQSPKDTDTDVKQSPKDIPFTVTDVNQSLKDTESTDADVSQSDSVLKG